MDDAGSILLVDDEPSVLRSFRLLLEVKGHRVKTAVNGDEALAHLTSGSFDLVLTDIGMPRIDGLDLAVLVRERHPDVLTIAMTGAPSIESATQALRTGVQDYLIKPVSADELHRAVSGALELKRLREENERLRYELDQRLAVRTAEAKQSAEQLARVASNVPGVIFQCVVDAQGRFHFPFIAKSCQRILGLAPESIREDPETLLECFEDAHRARFRETLLQAAQDQAQWSFEGRVRGRDGEPLWLRADSRPLQRPTGEVVYDGVLVDITARKNVEKQLAHAAYHDALTGLPNRAFFIEKLATLIEQARRSGNPFALLFLDLDRFKVINDSLGHGVGDRVLVAIARRLELRLLTDTVWIARLGGDEFVIVVQAGEPVVTHVARHVVSSFTEPVEVEGRAFYISMSIGVAPWRESYSRPEEMMRDADLAMYRAKGQGNQRFARFDDKMQRDMVERLRLETDLQRGLQESQFELYYQPIISLASGQATAVEALIRWNHPERGKISPSVFIPLAEEIGLIHRLGRWVLSSALDQMVAWRERYPRALEWTISVNLSTFQFNRTDLVSEIREALRVSTLPPQALTLEITESALLEEHQGNISKIEALRELGVRMQIDDFGVGYSNLSYLARLPVDGFKIDRSFIEGIERQPTRRKIVSAIVELARSLDISTTAEGVETQEQLDILAELEQDRFQGFLFARPMSAQDLERDWLQEDERETQG